MNILVVDDHRESAEALAALFAARGHSVLTVEDPLAALVQTRDFTPDVAILDLGLPRMDGYELAEHLRVNGATYRLIVVTGQGERDSRRCAKLGITGYFRKPVTFEELVRAVEV